MQLLMSWKVAHYIIHRSATKLFSVNYLRRHFPCLRISLLAHVDREYICDDISHAAGRKLCWRRHYLGTRRASRDSVHGSSHCAAGWCTGTWLGGCALAGRCDVYSTNYAFWFCSRDNDRFVGQPMYCVLCTDFHLFVITRCEAISVLLCSAICRDKHIRW